jgi:hypothetical protein
MKDEGEKVRIGKIKKKANDTFKEWKQELCKAINSESRLIMFKDGTFQFLLPQTITHLVWSTTMRERIKAMMAGDAVSLEDAKGRALKSIRDELDKAYDEFSKAPEEQAERAKAEAKEKAEKEEAEAAATIAKLREEMVRGKESNND